MKPGAFDFKVRKNPRPIVVEFWAPWCGPCKMMAPYLKQAEQEFSGRVDLLKVNADENPDVLKSLGIRGIPTMIGYNQGEEVARKTGAMTPDNVQGFSRRFWKTNPSTAHYPGLNASCAFCRRFYSYTWVPPTVHLIGCWRSELLSCSAHSMIAVRLIN